MKIGYQVNFYYGNAKRLATVDRVNSKTHLDLTVRNPNRTSQKFLNVAIKPTQENLQLAGVPYWTEKKQEESKVKVVSKTTKNK